MSQNFLWRIALSSEPRGSTCQPAAAAPAHSFRSVSSACACCAAALDSQRWPVGLTYQYLPVPSTLPRLTMVQPCFSAPAQRRLSVRLGALGSAIVHSARSTRAS